MANIINQVSVFAGAGNTGAPRTVIEEGIYIGVILVPSGDNPILTNTNLQSASAALAALQASTYAARAARIFPIGPFANLEATDTDRTTEESALGVRRTIRRGKIGRRFEIWSGGAGYHQAVFAFDGTDMRALMVDDKNNIIGTWVENGSGQKELFGFTLSDFAVSNYNPPTGTTGGKFFIDLQFANDSEMNTAKAIVNLGVPVLTNVTGLADVDIQDDDTAGAGTDKARVKLFADQGATDVFDFYAAEMAQAGAWDVRDAADDSTTVVVASVAQNAARKSWSLTLTSPPAAVIIRLKSASILHGLTTSVSGIESSDSLEVTIP